VTFGDQATFSHVLATDAAQIFHGRRLAISIAQPKGGSLPPSDFADDDRGGRDADLPSPGSSSGPPRQPSERLFVGKLPDSVSEEALRAYFEQFGSLADVYMPKEYETGRPRGFGFVTFALEGGVDHALAAAPHVVDGVELEVKLAQPKVRSVRNVRNVGGQRGRVMAAQGAPHALMLPAGARPPNMMAMSTPPFGSYPAPGWNPARGAGAQQQSSQVCGWHTHSFPGQY